MSFVTVWITLYRQISWSNSDDVCVPPSKSNLWIIVTQLQTITNADRYTQLQTNKCNTDKFRQMQTNISDEVCVRPSNRWIIDARLQPRRPGGTIAKPYPWTN